MYKLGIVLIHNHDPERLRDARSAISEFLRILPDGVHAENVEVSFQPPVVSVTVLGAIRAWALSWTGDYRWQNYLHPSERLRGRIRRLRLFLRILGKSLGKHLRRRKRIAIAEALTSKNIRAWERLLDSDWDGVLILEDDVTLNNHDDGTIEDALNLLREVGQREPLFASLAQAYPPESIGGGQLVTEIRETTIFFRRPVTNTAAAYFLNRPAAEAFLVELSKRPAMKRIPADWLLNHLFMRLCSVEPHPFACFHTRRGVFENRSLTGQIASQVKV